jgi:hypothetical protein
VGRGCISRDFFILSDGLGGVGVAIRGRVMCMCMYLEGVIVDNVAGH